MNPTPYYHKLTTKGQVPARLREKIHNTRVLARLVFSRGVIMLWQIESVPKGRGSPWKGAVHMAIQVCWLNDLAKAQETARKLDKPILLDFFNPQ